MECLLALSIRSWLPSELLDEKSGRYEWGKGLDPLTMFKGQLGETLADTTNPSPPFSPNCSGRFAAGAQPRLAAGLRVMGVYRRRWLEEVGHTAPCSSWSGMFR